ncbi:OLC1v1008426C1 [Oldenlandia corymbosa var. corymbosa]|uniref:RNA helicase n=1 Tax=Oldenlandia corymbosa var. corymbosa TaxID=529605 RepID=A0AAV1DLI8_OLDCO|nr:OLC1v1008426C1 [Oldenlandia corymbosa var. corymbosa]
MGRGNGSDDEYSVIGEKGDLGFIDFEKCKDSCSYNPAEESDIVTISVPFPLVGGKPQSGLVGETIVDSVTIHNKTNGSIDIWSINIYDSKPEGSFTLSVMEPPTPTSDAECAQRFQESFSLEDRVLQPERALTIWLSCKPKGIGLHTSAVHFSVGDEVIERVVFIMAEDKISQSLASGRPFNQARKKKQSGPGRGSAEPFVACPRPIGTQKRSSNYRLPTYAIPKDIRDLLGQKQVPDAIYDGLTRQNYVFYFHTLLALEEIKMEEDMNQYDMEYVTLKKKGFQFLSLEVPGLAEKRPSLLHGDCVFAKLSSDGATKNTIYQGFIHHVEAEEVSLKFSDDFHAKHCPGNQYDIQFTYNRVGVRRLYQAIEAASGLQTEILFPDFCKERIIHPTPMVPMSCMLNEEQLGAIQMILGCKGGSPYVIHGPPGTGKTITVVEAILQLYSKKRNSRTLVCAPSNSAADNILEKILSANGANIQGNDIFRLNAVTRSPEEVDPKYIDYCYLDNSFFSCPPLKNLMQFRIVVSTYTSACLLHAEGIRRGHFSHIFLDEAGQASEPETMVPIAHFCHANTVVTLAGDPQQLGPLTFSKISENFGLGKSYLERLFESDVYGYGNRNYITKLVRNYRSHPKILELPSKLFYGGSLIPCKKSDERSSTAFLDLLPNEDFPLLFIGIQGCDEREGNNPSWFNRVEASKVVEIIVRLIDDKGLCEEDIGVITPYRQQVLKIRTALDNFNKFNVKVGSVEQFQGQEKEVIIVSTVRSTIKHNDFDRIHYLGFLSNPKRFNVAITRARSLLILVGNPHIISEDENWNELLWYCADNQSYEGCFMPPRQEVVEEDHSIPASYDYEGEQLGQYQQTDAECYADEWGNNNQPSGDLEWGDVEEGGNNYHPSGDLEWGDVDGGGNNHQPSGDLECGDVDGGGNNPQPSRNVECADNSLNTTEKIPEPVYDEAEWSDGWK